jgi:flagellar hook-associated protein 3 FlgL
MVYDKSIRDINRAYGELIAAQTQASTGKIRNNPSDDPRGASVSLYLSAKASRLEQYASNVNSARTLVSETESALTGISECLQSIKELVIQASSSTLSQSEREDICTQISQYRDQILVCLNASGAGGHILGGYNTKSTPMTQSGGTVFYNGVALADMTGAQYNAFVAQTISVTVMDGIQMDATITALDVTGYGDGNLFATLDELVLELSKSDPDETALVALREQLDGHTDCVLTRLTETGSKENRLDMIKARLENTRLAVEELISKNDDVDIEESIIRYTMTEQAYQATLSVIGKSVRTSLLDYLD